MLFAQEAAQGAEVVGLVITGGVIGALGYLVWRTRQKASREYWERRHRQRAEDEERRRRMKGLE